MLVVTLNGMKLLPGKKVDPSTFNEISSLEKKIISRKVKYSKVEMADVDLSMPTEAVDIANIDLSTPKGVNSEIV
jgi:hypothetical protein